MVSDDAHTSVLPLKQGELRNEAGTPAVIIDTARPIDANCTAWRHQLPRLRKPPSNQRRTRHPINHPQAVSASRCIPNRRRAAGRHPKGAITLRV